MNLSDKGRNLPWQAGGDAASWVEGMKRVSGPWRLLWKDQASRGEISAVRLSARKLFKVWMAKWRHSRPHFGVLGRSQDFRIPT